MYLLRPVGLILLISFGALFITGAVKSDPEHVKPDRGERPKAGVTIGPGDTPDPLTAEALVVSAFYEEQARLEQEAITAYLDSLETTRLAAVAEANRVAAARQAATSQQPQRGTGSGDCAAVAAVVGAGTVQHESTGNPLAENGQYKGCAQISTGWWNGACAGLDWHNVADQAQCAQIVMNTQGPSAWSGTYGQ